MKNAAVFVEKMLNKQQQRLPIDRLVPELLSTGEATVIYDVPEEARRDTHIKLRKLLEQANVMSAQVVTVGDMHHQTERVKLFPVTLEPGRLEDPKVFMECLVDYARSTVETNAAMPLSDDERGELEHMCDQYVGKYSDETDKVVAIMGQTTEFLFAKILKAYTNEPLLKDSMSVVIPPKQKDDDCRVAEGWHLVSKHHSPYSCTLQNGSRDVEEYDAVVRTENGFIACDVTCSSNLKEKMRREHVLPKIQKDSEVVIAHIGKSFTDVQDSRKGKPKVKVHLPLLQASQRWGASVYERNYAGTKEKFYQTVREFGW